MRFFYEKNKDLIIGAIVGLSALTAFTLFGVIAYFVCERL